MYNDIKQHQDTTIQFQYNYIPDIECTSFGFEEQFITSSNASERKSKCLLKFDTYQPDAKRRFCKIGPLSYRLSVGPFCRRREDVYCICILTDRNLVEFCFDKILSLEKIQDCKRARLISFLHPERKRALSGFLMCSSLFRLLVSQDFHEGCVSEENGPQKCIPKVYLVLPRNDNKMSGSSGIRCFKSIIRWGNRHVLKERKISLWSF